MKKKSFNKKLVLNKETIVNLNNASMLNLKGGGSVHSCNTVCDLDNDETNIICQVGTQEACLTIEGECPAVTYDATGCTH